MHPPDTLTPELQQLQTKAEAFARDTLCSLQPADPDARREAIAASKQANIFAMTQAEQYGGTQAGALELTLVRDTIASFNPPFYSAIFGPSPGVLADCQEPLRSLYLEPLMSGEKRGAFAFTEPVNASQPTTGIVTNGLLIINGEKSYVTGGAAADFLNTLIEVEDAGHAQGRTMVVIDTDAPGVVQTRKFKTLDGAEHAAYAFNNVQIPLTHMIGKPGDGMPRAMRQIDQVRLAIAALSVGWCRWVLNLVAEHLLAPHRTGEPLAKREGVRLNYGKLRTQTFAARSALYRTASLIDSGANAINEAMMTKILATETLAKVVDQGMQLFGGQSLQDDHPLAQLYRKARSLRIAEGATDVLHINVARGYLDLDKGKI